jgi:DNA-binding IclR family transcriptional regulator
VFAAISVSGPAWKMPLRDAEGMAKIVIHHAEAISRILGYRA